ncbi:hypothetical protein BTO28_13685 [Domibacillus epiphyticus]|uniref:Spo0E family sporulation regulatory protein-aspartic acid phosphatase n=1 Tax=Domibacillus epiphyticus TaxID=1714355 RepID=A0A1V2A5F6_9BACI|nr:aspartyl-phosphate phosphatase Spo0E family protein [Domibacillus epiphyticus]OMP66167.1 hypothetical protein BTO28_13685 [Domibacillus epiphyticus]
MVQIQENSNKILSSRITHLRELMILIGTSKGLDSVETLKYSEELDKLIFQFQLQNRS